MTTSSPQTASASASQKLVAWGYRYDGPVSVGGTVSLETVHPPASTTTPNVKLAAPTEERDRRVAELEALSDTRNLRRFELRDQKERTEAEEAELKQLNELYDTRMRELAAFEAAVFRISRTS